MFYVAIPLSQDASKLLTICFPFGFYEPLVLPKGITPVTDIFQARMVSCFASMRDQKPNPYLDDILHTKGKTFEEHLTILAEVLRRLAEAGMQINAGKSKFVQMKLEFVGFSIERDGYRPLKKRVEAILRIEPPANVKGVKMFLGVLNFIKNHIKQRAEILTPITELTKKEVPFIWGERQQKAFEKAKAAIA